ncbi:MAG: (deoxy)nucleoside triphosphate pyrophosphohydrolase [Succinivibrio sp.]|nr:(deoxy)nucleoside triphosphate pyrophosphohydrolase [Succinivibrio sp.]
MKTINVVAAIIVSADRKIFATQRGYGDYKGWWEFPGGKIEDGESKEEALKREIFEELACPIRVDGFFDAIEFDYPKFHLHMDCFLCSLDGKAPSLLEHMSAKWLSLSELKDVKWLEADLSIIEKLRITL